jgi:hypothetical protein
MRRVKKIDIKVGIFVVTFQLVIFKIIFFNFYFAFICRTNNALNEQKIKYIK